MRLEGSVLLNGALVPGAVSIENQRIASVDLDSDATPTPGSPVIAPGLMDLHLHGFGGHGPLEDLLGMARALARHGTTAFQPTLFPAHPEPLGQHCAAVESAAGKLAVGDGARVLGLHLEGPFVNRAAAGALPPEDLAEPSLEGLRAILGPATGGGRMVRTVTLAPELPGMSELIAELGRCGVRASMGHSRATEAQARSGARAGALGATHLYNAMTGMHHRDAGLAGTALTDALIFAEIIGDLVHVAVPAFEVALSARGPGGLCLVSDALAVAGTGCDVFHSSGREHVVRDGAAFYPAREPEGELQLAGSASSQLEMVRRLTSAGVCSLAEALTMASSTPARALGLSHEFGVIAPGMAADLIVLRGPQLKLERCLVAGKDQAL